MTNEQLTAALASLALDRETEAAMTPGEWGQSEEEVWDCNGPSACPCRAVDEWTPAACPTPYLITGAWIEGPRFLESWEACYFTNADALGIARARNRWAALTRVAEAAGQLVDDPRWWMGACSSWYECWGCGGTSPVDDDEPGVHERVNHAPSCPALALDVALAALGWAG